MKQGKTIANKSRIIICGWLYITKLSPDIAVMGNNTLLKGPAMVTGPLGHNGI